MAQPAGTSTPGGNVDPATWSAIATAVLSLFKGLGFKSHTQHFSWAEDNTVSLQLTNGVLSLIKANISAGQLSSFAADAKSAIMNFMSNNPHGWWAVGNDPANRAMILRDLANDPASDGYGSIWRLCMWIYGDAPADNPKEATDKINIAFSETIYPILTGYGKTQLVDALTSLVTQAGGGTAPSTSSKSLSFWDLLFGNKQSSTTSGPMPQTASVFQSPLVIILTLGAATWFVVQGIRHKI